MDKPVAPAPKSRLDPERYAPGPLTLIATHDAKVRVSWRRVLVVKPYETETLELGVEDRVRVPDDVRADTFLAQLAKQYFDQLVIEGDKLTQARLRKPTAS